MEVIVIEAAVFNKLTEKVGLLSEKVKRMSKGNSADSKEWLDSQEVCELLGLSSKRTVQYYRERGLLEGSLINGKIYFKKEDIENFINKKEVKNGL